MRYEIKKPVPFHAVRTIHIFNNAASGNHKWVLAYNAAKCCRHDSTIPASIPAE
jgi:hypothetical protein